MYDQPAHITNTQRSPTRKYQAAKAQISKYHQPANIINQ
jgi:hypothetical protein